MNDSSRRSVRSRVIRAAAAAATVAIGITIFALGGHYLGGREVRTERAAEIRAVSADVVQAQAREGKRNVEPRRATKLAHKEKTVKTDPRRESRALRNALFARKAFEKSEAINLRFTIEDDAGMAPRRSFHIVEDVVLGKTSELQRDLHSPEYEMFSFYPVTFLDTVEPLLDFAINYDRIRIARMLIEDGANVNGVGVGANGENETPLQNAAQADNAQVAKLLIEHGANIEGRGRPTRQRGRQPTPLGYALSVQSPNVALLLLKHGASLRKALGPGMMIPNWIAYPTAHGYREGAADTTRIDRLRSLLVSEGATLPPRNGGQ